MKKADKILCIAGIIILVAFVYTLFDIQTTAEKARDEICMSAGIGDVMEMAQGYADDHDCYFPTYGDKIYDSRNREFVIGSNAYELLCPITGAPFNWAKKRYNVVDDPDAVLLWDSEPHGHLLKRCNIVFASGETKTLSEKELRELISEN